LRHEWAILQRKHARCLLATLLWLAIFSSGTIPLGASQLANAPRQPASSAPQTTPPTRQAYVGDAACRPCHEQASRTFAETAHHLTSRLPSKNSIAGKFSPGSNVLHTSNPYLSFVMSTTKDGYFESAVEELAPSKTMSHTERIDLVVGSGRKGQTYLFWKGDRLFELPVSYWTELDSWINSPGYPDGSPHFDKPVVPRCLECHSGFFEWAPPPANRYKKTTVAPGIGCENCHGPGREHVARYSSKSPPGPGLSTAILNPGVFPRERQIDLCALCHAGAAETIAPPLSFTPGQAIDDYLYIPLSDKDAPVDVHGNQIQLLARSRCFRSSRMTCMTCHEVHKLQRDAAAFSEHCLSCHKVEACGRYPQLGKDIAKNCVDCHMPLQESELLVSDTNGRKLKPRVRNHRIAIYPDETIHGTSIH
jgi:Cytochrome c554 and c-prime